MPLLTWGPAGTLAKDVATQFEGQGRLVEEANRDLSVFKNAYTKAEQEKEALMNKLKVRDPFRPVGV